MSTLCAGRGAQGLRQDVHTAWCAAEETLSWRPARVARPRLGLDRSLCGTAARHTNYTAHDTKATTRGRALDGPVPGGRCPRGARLRHVWHPHSLCGTAARHTKYPAHTTEATTHGGGALDGPIPGGRCRGGAGLRLHLIITSRAGAAACAVALERTWCLYTKPLPRWGARPMHRGRRGLGAGRREGALSSVLLESENRTDPDSTLESTSGRRSGCASAGAEKQVFCLSAPADAHRDPGRGLGRSPNGLKVWILGRRHSRSLDGPGAACDSRGASLRCGACHTALYPGSECVRKNRAGTGQRQGWRGH